MQFHQTRSNAIILYNTLPAMRIEKVVIMKSGEELYGKTYQSLIAPQRVVLKPNLNGERQDTTSSDARKSIDHADKHGGTYTETCRGDIDFRIQGLPHSAVQEHDHICKKAVQKLIHQFENHPNKEANPFSEKSKEMIYSMGHMEYFEICEITPNMQCPTCMTYWPKGVENCTCGACVRPSKFENSTVTATMFCQFPITSSKSDHPMGDATGNPERQRIYY